MSILLALAGLALVALALPAGAGAHAERATFFPNPDLSDFPEIRTTGPALVVCAEDSKQRIKKYHGPTRARQQRLLAQCEYDSIQDAVNDASNGTRIRVLPGVYEELGSREPAPAGCEDVYERTENGQFALSYDEHRQCPNAQNLIAILGDTDGDRICDAKCDIQIEGVAPGPDAVKIDGDRSKLNVFRADRADGFVLRNLTVELSDFNNVYVLETNGFRISSVVSGYSREYGVLSFTSDHGIYENCDAYGNGDSGVYPGSGPDRHGQPDAHGHVYGIVIRNCNSHDNNIGSSGTAGNGTLYQNNRFHDNAIGATVDSFAGGHPGQPQDASKWTNNLIYSNNKNIFSDDRDAYCKQPAEQRDPTVVCPTFQVPVGTGLLTAGGNDNIVEGNYIFDNWRRGTMLHWVPASLRGEPDPAKGFDTSNNNAYIGNCMSVRPPSLGSPDFNTCQGTRDANGVDFWWDEEDGQDCAPDVPGCVDTETVKTNCWSGNVGPNGGQPRSDPGTLPVCPGFDAGLFVFPNISKLLELLPCAEWNPDTNTDPPGCNWFTLPPEPN